MKKNPANAIKDTMWTFLTDKGQKPNLEALKEAAYDLIQLTTQKNAGQRKAKKDINWDELDMVMMTIAIEATALVLSEDLDRQIPEKPKDVSNLDDISKNYKIGICRRCETVIDTTANYCGKCGQRIDWEVDNEWRKI